LFIHVQIAEPDVEENLILSATESACTEITQIQHSQVDEKIIITPLIVNEPTQPVTAPTKIKAPHGLATECTTSSGNPDSYKREWLTIKAGMQLSIACPLRG
jgi:hypothetical protein